MQIWHIKIQSYAAAAAAATCFDVTDATFRKLYAKVQTLQK
jgi:hypothetical protein